MTASAPTPPPQMPAAGFFDSIRRNGLVRTEQRWIGGVAGGLAQRTGLDPTLVRCLWIIATLLSGVAALLYGVAWLLLPEERDGRIHAQQALMGDVSAGLAGALGMSVLGMTSIHSSVLTFTILGTLWNPITSVGWVALIVVVVLLLVRRSKYRSHRTSASGGFPTPNPASQGASPQSDSAGAGEASVSDPFLASPAGPVAATSTADGAADSTVTAAAEASSMPAHAGEPFAAVPAEAAAAPAASAGTLGTAGTAAATAPTTALPVTPTPVPPKPRKKRAPGPGRRVSLLVIALSVLSVMGVVLGLSAGSLSPIGAALIMMGSGTALLGAGVITSALRGRRGTWMTWLGWPALFCSLPVLIFGSLMPAHTINEPLANSVGHDWNTSGTVVVTADMLEDGDMIDLGSYSAGVLTLDFTKIKPADYPKLENKRLNASVGTGRILIDIPEGIPLKINSSQNLGYLSGNFTRAWKGADVNPETMSSQRVRRDLNGNPKPRYHIWSEQFPPQQHFVSSPNSDENSSTLTVNMGVGDILIDERPSTVTWDGWIADGIWVVASWTDSKGDHFPDIDETLQLPGVTAKQVPSPTAYQCIDVTLAKKHVDKDQDGIDDYDGYAYNDPQYILDNFENATDEDRQAIVDCLNQDWSKGDPNPNATTSPSSAPSPTTEPTSAPTPQA